MAKSKFRFVDHVAPADAAFEAYGEDLPQLFASAAQALFSVIVDLELIEPKVARQVSLTADGEESLLYDWLSELVYLKDVHRELYSEFDLLISTGEVLKLVATARGNSVDSVREQVHTDVKAVTYHKLKVEKTESGLKAFVIVDL